VGIERQPAACQHNPWRSRVHRPSARAHQAVPRRAAKPLPQLASRPWALNGKESASRCLQRPGAECIILRGDKSNDQTGCINCSAAPQSSKIQPPRRRKRPLRRMAAPPYHGLVIGSGRSPMARAADPGRGGQASQAEDRVPGPAATAPAVAAWGRLPFAIRVPGFGPFELLSERAGVRRGADRNGPTSRRPKQF